MLKTIIVRVTPRYFCNNRLKEAELNLFLNYNDESKSFNLTQNPLKAYRYPTESKARKAIHQVLRKYSSYNIGRDEYDDIKYKLEELTLEEE